MLTFVYFLNMEKLVYKKSKKKSLGHAEKHRQRLTHV